MFFIWTLRCYRFWDTVPFILNCRRFRLFQHFFKLFPVCFEPAHGRAGLLHSRLSGTFTQGLSLRTHTRSTLTPGYSDFVLVFGKKNSKNILEKAFFYIFCGFLHNWGFVIKFLKNGPSERWKISFLEIGHWLSKIENFMQISKILICLSDKMLPNIIKI
jgi:hypothetical protein